MESMQSSVNSGWLRLLTPIGLLLVLFAPSMLAIVLSYRLQGDNGSPRLVHTRHSRPTEYVQLLGISERARCIVECVLDTTKIVVDVLPGPITINGYAWESLAPLWHLQLLDKDVWCFDILKSSVSCEGSYLALEIFMLDPSNVHNLQSSDHLHKPDYVQLVFIDPKQGKVVWVWPDKPVLTKQRTPRELRPSQVCFANEHEAYWLHRLAREPNEKPSWVLYKLDIPRREAKPFLSERDKVIQLLQDEVILQGYCAATQELLVSSGKVLYGISLGANPCCRVVLEEGPGRVQMVSMSRKGHTITVLGADGIVFLSGPPAFQSRSAIVPGLAYFVACSPEGQYIASSYFTKPLAPEKVIIWNLSGRPVMQFLAEPVGAGLGCPIIWFPEGRKIAVNSVHEGWAILELVVLK